MFSGKKSYGKTPKKTQETQSPVTKLFKKMCKSSDSSSGPERENLLKQKKKTKKQQSTIACECHPPPACPAPADRCPPCDDMARRWNAGQHQGGSFTAQDRDDTFSCTSCALKKCLTSDPPKLVFLVCIALTFLLIAGFLNWWSCRPQPVLSDMFGEEKRERRSDDTMEDDRKPWDASKSRLMNGLSELMGPGNRDSSMHDMDMDQFGNSLPELSSILDPVKVNEAYSRNSLRNFYKKLLKTDVQIKNLKKSFAALKRGNNNAFFDPIPPRAKRSLKVFTDTTRAHFETPPLNKRSLKNLNIYYPPSIAMKAVNDIDINIKEDTDMGAFPDPNSVSEIAKEQKLLRKYSSTHKNDIIQAVKYTPFLMNYKTKSYQHELKHPYNKNSEKLDELLGRLLDKQAPEATPNIEDMVLNGDENNELKRTTKLRTNPMKAVKEEDRCEETNISQLTTKLKNAPQKTTEDSKSLYLLRDNTRYDEYKQTTTAMKADDAEANMELMPTEANQPELTSDNFEYMITLAAVLGPPSNKFRKNPTEQRVYFPKLRRLLQHPKNYDEDEDEDEDEEDDDDAEAVDYEEQTKEPWDREKRMLKPMELELQKEPESVSTIELPGMRNPNWKGPMPLYHDELNYMIKAAIKMAAQKSADKYSKETKSSTKENNNEYDDHDANENYDELVEMAQAYSDYGVLDGKKESIEKNKVPVNALSITSAKRNEILERIKNKVDKPRQILAQKFKLNGKVKSNSDKLLKKLGFDNNVKRFSKDHFSEPEANPDLKDFLTAPSILSNAPIHKITNYRYPAETVTVRDMVKAHPKESQNHKERSVYTRHRRSLKSIEIDNLNDDVATGGIEPDVGNKDIYENKTDIHFKDTLNDTSLERKFESNVFNGTDNEVNIPIQFKGDSLNLSNETQKHNNNKTSLGLGDIFGMIADFCLFLAGFDNEQEKSDYRFLYDFMAILNPNILHTKNKTIADKQYNDTAILNPNNLHMKNKTIADKQNNDTRVPITAMFDSETVENIGRRSRVLMSFEEKVDNFSSTNNQEKEERSESYVITNTEKIDISIKNKTTNLSNADNMNELNEFENRSVVKRSANGNLLTWNDLYDDEYGVKDKMDNDMKEKAIDKYNELLSKSENWIGTKFKQIANTMKKGRKHWKSGKNKDHSARNKTMTLTKRSVPKLIKDSGKQTFEALTANMKKVFHEAAEAIHDTGNREARSDSEQASTLMQQLVALMSELVDIQVRQKTCVQLPEDLRSFLAWLTTPTPQERNDISFVIDSTYDSGPATKNYLNADTYELLSPNTRNECLGTIHDVEDLIQQYDDMSEEDKSKMSGVREYLEHQLDFLHKQLFSFNEYGFPVMYQEHTIRRRRQLPKQLKNKKRGQRKANRFLKYFGRKRTKSTVYAEEVIVTEDYNTMKRTNDKIKKDRNKNDNNEAYGKGDVKSGFAKIVKNKDDVNENERFFHDKVSKENTVKRNLQDVYYSPLGRTNATTVKYGRT